MQKWLDSAAAYCKRNPGVSEGKEMSFFNSEVNDFLV